jgi:2',3'-cyclic-nucleotide 2'-phosphodiesterase (5'-nucleotidase family)
MKRLAAAAAVFTVALAAVAQAATQSLVILHDNDLHGHLRSFCYTESGRSPDEHCDVGGAAKRATLVAKMRRTAKAPVLLIDAGDTSTRGPLATEYEGKDEIAAMNAMRYSMAAVGNNEFKLKDSADIDDAAGAQADLAALVKLSRFPWLCANATDEKGALLAGVKPFVVRKFGKLRIAFLGLTAPRSASYPQTRGLVIGDPVAAAKIWIPRARAVSDVVIAVTHVGVDDDRRLVRETRGLAAVVGGDSHTFLYEPVVEKNLDGREIPIVQDGEFGVNLGRFDLTFSGNPKRGWRLTRYSDRLIPVDAAIKRDPRVAALVERYAAPLDVRVGHVAVIGDTPDARKRLTAEILAQSFQKATGADVGIAPEAALFEVFRTNDVTRYQIRAILPFHDTLWKGEIAGAALKDLVSKPSPLGGMVRATIAASEIDPAKTYTVASTVFVGRLIAPTGADTKLEARDAVEAWIREPVR